MMLVRDLLLYVGSGLPFLKGKILVAIESLSLSKIYKFLLDTKAVLVPEERVLVLALSCLVFLSRVDILSGIALYVNDDSSLLKLPSKRLL